MNPDTANRLLELNRQFYQTFALQFAATRSRLQPGVKRLIEFLPPQLRLLDLGCGNGELWHYLSRLGHTGAYTGLDSSAEMLHSAIANVSNHGPQAGLATFVQVDLSDPDWDAALRGSSFDVAVAFALLHHLPGQKLRQRVLQKIRSILAPAGCFYHSEWQFLNSPRLRARIQPWESIQVSANQVDPGDYLLDWRQGGYGLRYVHHFNQAELAMLAQESGFQITETFLSDGKGGNLSLYQIWVIV
jgi:tRNA (uracil-5-)-methyltransferase TRM9